MAKKDRKKKENISDLIYEGQNDFDYFITC